MKKIIFTIPLILSSFITNAAPMMFSQLNCSDVQEATSTILQIKLKEPLNVINNSGLDKAVNTEMTLTYFVDGEPKPVSLGNISIRQATGAYKYELGFQGQVLDSSYNSFLSLHPDSVDALTAYRGEVEINAVIDGNDYLMMKSRRLNCTVTN